MPIKAQKCTVLIVGFQDWTVDLTKVSETSMDISSQETEVSLSNGTKRMMIKNCITCWTRTEGARMINYRISQAATICLVLITICLTEMVGNQEARQDPTQLLRLMTHCSLSRHKTWRFMSISSIFDTLGITVQMHSIRSTEIITRAFFFLPNLKAMKVILLNWFI